MLESIRNYLNNKDYNINISENIVYINNYSSIEKISEKIIIIKIKNFKLKAEGSNFKLTKMIDKEILFNGSINKIEIITND